MLTDKVENVHPPVMPLPSTYRLLVTARSSAAVASARADIKRRARQAAVAPLVNEEERVRAYKKRHTSSDVPAPEEDFFLQQDVDRHVYDGPHEADPDGDNWSDDLDAEDADDLFMVSMSSTSSTTSRRSRYVAIFSS